MHLGCTARSEDKAHCRKPNGGGAVLPVKSKRQNMQSGATDNGRQKASAEEVEEGKGGGGGLK